MKPSPRTARTLAFFFASWVGVVTAMSLWVIRGSLGFQGTTYVPVTLNTQLGAFETACSIQTPIRPNRPHPLNCQVTNQTKQVADVGIAVSGTGFSTSLPSQRATILPGETRSFAFELTPTHTGIASLIVSYSVAEVFRAIDVDLDVELGWRQILFAALFVAASIAGFYSGFITTFRSKDALDKEVKERIAQVEIKAEQAPEKAKYAWELATVRLEAYFDRNCRK